VTDDWRGGSFLRKGDSDFRELDPGKGKGWKFLTCKGNEE